MKINGYKILTPLIISAALVIGVTIGLAAGRSSVNNRLRMLAGQLDRPGGKIDYALSLIERYYVDSVSTDSLVERLLPDLLWYLDPHSVYIPAAEMAEVNMPLDGEFDGIGVTFNMSSDTIVVLNVIPQGPSERAGVINGDRIITINDSLVAGQQLPTDAVMKMLRGPRGTEVDVEVMRQGIDGLVPITIVRDKIPVKSVSAALMLTPEIAFMKITTFSQHTHDEMLEALDRLRAQGMRSLIIDLRGNSGGYMGQPILMANEFLAPDKLIVYTEDRQGVQVKEYSDGSGAYTTVGLAVLIDENSASSSEILAGALQDNDRATIIGRRSYGKGLVQQQIPFSDGSAMRLTTARYYTPTGRSIQKPYTSADTEYGYDIYNRYIHNEMFSADSIRFDDSLKFVTPGGRTVYGGGGIMPDVFVPLDTTAITPYYVEVLGRNILYRYVIEYSDRHRERINSITSIEELNRFLDSDSHLLEGLVKYAEANGIAPDRNDINRSGELLTAIIRANIGRNTPLDDNGFYANYYHADPTILKAIEIIEAGNIPLMTPTAADTTAVAATPAATAMDAEATESVQSDSAE